MDEYRSVDPSPAPPRRRMLSLLLLPALFFLLGLAAMGWILSQWDYAARMIGVAPEPVAASQSPPPSAARPEPPRATPKEPNVSPVQETIVIDPEIGRRVNELEHRIAQIDTQSRVAVGNADRAEGLLVAFAARRALDRGVALGFLEALLRQRFGSSQPQAVGTIIAAAREPVTLQELQDGLQQVGPQLIGAGPDQSWWNALKAELGGLITVRREGSPSTEPGERLRRATRRLESGQVDVALAEVLRLPGREHAREWVQDARRYVGARRALDAIETAALLEPRTGVVTPAAPPSAGAQPAPQQPSAPAGGAR